MKHITLTFRTEKGKEAYKRVQAAGEKESRTNKAISITAFKDTVICEEPLTVRIKCKIPWIAKKIDLLDQIRKSLSDNDAEEGLDYYVEVVS